MFYILGIGATGAAIIDPQLKMATITINSSNYPHGLLQFSQTSLEIVKEEQDVMINLQIERKFGNIGLLKLYSFNFWRDFFFLSYLLLLISKSFCISESS